MSDKISFLQKIIPALSHCDKSKHIPMELFISFLVDVNLIRAKDNLGIDIGYTILRDETKGLILSGYIFNGVEYLDRIEYGKNLKNSYNNYCNPFNIWEMLTEKGKHFFLNYYKDVISNKRIELFNHLQYLKSTVEEHEKTISLMSEILGIDTAL
jgi:hypothetical protein